MEIGSRVIEGEIKGREDAKKAYEAAKGAGQKASLVEQERPNIFTNSVANIGPHEAIVVRIEYQETVKQDAGVYSLRFPLVVGAPLQSRAERGHARSITASRCRAIRCRTAIESRRRCSIPPRRPRSIPCRSR